MTVTYEAVGVLTVWVLVTWFLIKVIKGIWTTWLAHLLGMSVKWNPSSDTWAVITGATDGIGLEFARELAKKGFNLFLISRNPEKLETVKAQLAGSLKSGRSIEILAIDFGKRDVYGLIEEKLKPLKDIGVLVNNVGTSYCTPEYFTQLEVTNKDPNFVETMININILATTKMMKIVLPRMEEKKRGIVINLSSLSAAYPTPLLSLYGASKIYVDFLSRGVQAEYADKGIIIQSLLPSYVSTNMSKIRKASFLVPTAPAYVKGALKTVGVESRTYGYWTHKLQGFVQDQIFGTLYPKLNTDLALMTLKPIRAAYYRKYMKKD